jgi:hypothetical protein
LGSEGIAPRIIDLGTRWRWVVSFTPRSFDPQGERAWYPLDRRLGGHDSRSGHGGEKKNFQPLSVLEPPIIQLVVQIYTTELFRFLGSFSLEFKKKIAPKVAVIFKINFSLKVRIRTYLTINSTP